MSLSKDLGSEISIKSNQKGGCAVEKQDKIIVCQDCGEEFTFTVRDQEFYEEKGFTNEPKRCKACRDKKKAEKRNSQSFNRAE